MADSHSGPSIFSVRIVSIDYYMATPIPGYDFCYSSHHGGMVNEVPVIRIYGSTPAGQKTCLHIHRALPYLYVPCSDIPLDPRQGGGDAYTHAISMELEKALKLKGNAGWKRQHVHGCEIVKAKKFYGYHSSDEAFVKMYLYFPHDVARAANLILAGAIFGKSLQPYESHIPFILQFLVDYNLYGMGHVHISQMKFRHPVPDRFLPRRFSNDGQRRSEVIELAITAVDFQADSSTGLSFSSPIWIISTIPGDWMWHLTGADLSLSQHLHHYRRQSSCELEGDAVVSDILNQQFKMYNPLSQTRSDVKMVQSLMSIWEEEYERTGMHAAAMPPDPGKPFAEDVLKTLSVDVEIESRLRELCDENGDNLYLPQHVKPTVASSAGEGNFVEDTLVEHSCPQMLDHATDRNSNEIVLPQPLARQEIPSEGKYASLISPYGNAVESSEVRGSPEFMGTDVEALGLLKWFALSQGAEDINSDDELLQECILSPMLPATSIDKVLEKANTDYESQSQKECQDILDSIEDITNLEDSEESSSRAVLHSDNPHTLTDRKLLEIDDFSDFPNFFMSDGSSENSFKRYTKCDTKGMARCQVLPDTSRIFSRRNRSSKSLCGTLPFPLTRNLNKEFETCSSNITRFGGTKEGCGASSTAGNELGSSSHNLVKHGNTGVCKLKDAGTLVGCSVRDLMRQKRLYRTESPDNRPVKFKKILPDREGNHSFSIPKHDVNDTRSPGSLDSGSVFTSQEEGFEETSSDSPKCSILHTAKKLPPEKEDLGTVSPETKKCGSSLAGRLCESFYGDAPSSAEGKHSDVNALNHSSFSITHLSESHSVNKSLAIETSKPKIAAVSSCLPALAIRGNMSDDVHDVSQQAKNSMELGREMFVSKVVGINMITNMEKFGSKEVGDASLSAYNSSLTMAGSMAEKTEICMALSKKPPALDWDGAAMEDNSHSAADENNRGGSGNAKEEDEDRNKFFEYSNFNDYCKEAIMGVPMHYLNDGSSLYLLTPAFSPPPVDSVLKWLSHDTGSLDCKIALERHSSHHQPVEVVSHGTMPEQADLLNNIILKEESNALPESKTVSKDEGKVAESNSQINGSQDISQISGPGGKSNGTPLSQIGFRDPANIGAGQQLTSLSIEIQAESRGNLRPDPRFDAVNVIALVVQNDNDSVSEVFVLLYSKSGSSVRNLDGISGCKVFIFLEERQLFSQFVKILCSWDPDIIMGWDIQSGSLGFLAERAAQLGIRLLGNISRTPSGVAAVSDNIYMNEKGIIDNIIPDPLTDPVQVEEAIIEDDWGRTHASGVHVGGRVVLNIWRLMCGEVKLNMYTIEAVAEAVLKRKIPSIPCKVLTKWFLSGPGCARYRCIEYVIQRANLNLEIMNQLDMINRTSELARVFGIDFFSVLSRGSQYRVESMFLRLAHTQNYLAISPGNQQVASQPAMECLPLVMEPESGFYSDPVVVLDFQSLYPSMIIAYNLCFCTCLGKIPNLKVNTLGVSSYSPEPQILWDLKSQILLTPNGVMYVPPKVCRGILPRLLEEILSTRIMVKQAMKKFTPSEQVLNRIYNARQLALKLIANVTYGYTAAGFSGRMPCAELADSIVQCGRSTLEKAISFVNSNEKWKARVVYGDTDSMFVLLKGRTVKEAFQIGQEIASAVTAMNPDPVTLKMEKVYHPCFLLTKKRYVGYSYESLDQIEPVFDAKGIETVRRDTCAAVAKIMEQSLRLYFEHQDLSKVKAYLHRQWKRILSGRVSLQDFVFAKEVRLGTYSSRDSSLLPPAAIVATQAMKTDPRAEPRYAERVPYVVIHGEPGARLVDMVVDPLGLLDIDSPYRLNDLYYINKQINPALQRVFGLVGADLSQWFSEMPRAVRESFGKRPSFGQNQQKTRIDYYYLSKHCILCGELVQASAHLCSKCLQKESAAAAAINGRNSKLEREVQHLVAICRECGGGDWLIESGVKCNSLACSVFYERRKAQKELKGLSSVASEKGLYPKCMVEWF